MPNVLVNDDSLKAIGNAIREKNGETTTYKPAEMAAAITAISGGGSSGYVPTDADLKLTGDCSNLFNSGKLKWIIDNYGNRITTEKISSTKGMFIQYIGDNVPFIINSDYELNCQRMFYLAGIKGTLPKIVMTKTTDYVSDIGSMFYGYIYDNIPDDYFNSMASVKIYKYVSMSGVFQGAKYITKIPSSWLTFTSKYPKTDSYYNPYNAAFKNCYSLKKLNNLHTFSSFAINENFFSETFNETYSLDSVTFAPLPEGTEYRQWKSQVISLNNYVGYGIGYNMIGIFDSNKRVENDTTYAALKNTDDWWSSDINYSRYNHDSAVETINSLPNTKPYLDANGGTNTIIFEGNAGAKTDGGAINTLTDAEIAVATAKGWTVSFT